MKVTIYWYRETIKGILINANLSLYKYCKNEVIYLSIYILKAQLFFVCVCVCPELIGKTTSPRKLFEEGKAAKRPLIVLCSV